MCVCVSEVERGGGGGDGGEVSDKEGKSVKSVTKTRRFVCSSVYWFMLLNAPATR